MAIRANNAEPSHKPGTVWSERPKYEPGELIFKLRQDQATRPSGTRGLSPARRNPDPRPGDLSDVLSFLQRNAGLELQSVTPLFQRSRARSGLRPARRSPSGPAGLVDPDSAVTPRLAGIFHARLDERALTPALIRKLNKDPRFEYVERIPTVWFDGAAAAQSSTVDPTSNVQWGLRAIRWFQANRMDASEVGVAVLDSGLDQHHPDFRGTSLAYEHFHSSPDDHDGHGTHVAGVVAADVNTRAGATGIVQCPIFAFKIMRDHPSIGGGEFTIVLEAIQRCLEIPMIRVVNMSFSTGEKSQAFRDAVESLAAANKVVVAAAGNHFTEGNPTVYPAAYPTVIAVGAVDAAGARGAFSCTGPHVALVAPGVGVVSTVPRKPHFRTTQTHYAALNGTSMAAPHVSAAVALLLAKHADLTPEQVRDRLVKSARRLPGMPKTGRTDELGYGLLDLERLLQ